MKPHTTILLPVPFQYKGAAEKAEAIRAKAAKDPRVQALAASIERSKPVIEAARVKIEESKKLLK